MKKIVATVLFLVCSLSFGVESSEKDSKAKSEEKEEEKEEEEEEVAECTLDKDLEEEGECLSESEALQELEEVVLSEVSPENYVVETEPPAQSEALVEEEAEETALLLPNERYVSEAELEEWEEYFEEEVAEEEKEEEKGQVVEESEDSSAGELVQAEESVEEEAEECVLEEVAAVSEETEEVAEVVDEEECVLEEVAAVSEETEEVAEVVDEEECVLEEVAAVSEETEEVAEVVDEEECVLEEVAAVSEETEEVAEVVDDEECVLEEVAAVSEETEEVAEVVDEEECVLEEVAVVSEETAEVAEVVDEEECVLEEVAAVSEETEEVAEVLNEEECAVEEVAAVVDEETEECAVEEVVLEIEAPVVEQDEAYVSEAELEEWSDLEEIEEPVAQNEEAPVVAMEEPVVQSEPAVTVEEPAAVRPGKFKLGREIVPAEVVQDAPVVAMEEPVAVQSEEFKWGCEIEPEPVEIMEELKGILFLGYWNLVRKEPLDCVSGVVSAEVGLLGAHPEFRADLQGDFIGKPLTDQTILQIKQAVADFYAANHQPFVVISIPRQEVTQGVLQVVVDEAKVGEIRCKGNEYYTSQDLLRHIRVKPGEPVIAKTLAQDLMFLNQNPFRHTDVLFTPGMKPGTTDIELLTVDRWPYRIYGGADNTGTISTERNRIFFGFNFGKTIVRDSEMSFQYTAAPNINLFYAYTGLFRIPCPWRHIVQGYGGYTRVRPETGVSDLHQKGVSWQVDLRYRIPLFEDPDLLQEIIVGYDFKETNNDIIFGGDVIFHGDADINQFMIGYELGNRNRQRKITFNFELYGNPGQMTTHDKRSSYQKLRYEAQPRYVYLRVNHSLWQESMSGFYLSYNLSGQVASTNLLPSEQFTMTGYNAVRGFEERILNLDNAAIVNFTMELPHFSPAYLMGFKRYDDFYIHIFADMGLGGNHKPMPGEHRFYTLGSVGPGARYQFSRYCTARFDYGVQLWHVNFNPITHSRYNFGVVLSY